MPTTVKNADNPKELHRNAKNTNEQQTNRKELGEITVGRTAVSLEITT